MTLGPAIWFTPHQDDETLFMGASIVQHVRAGRRCFVVLCTDGGTSGVVVRYPTKIAFVKERDREFRAAVTRLGATPIIHPRRATDGRLSVALAKSIIMEYITKYPTGSFKTLSETDASPDHAALGFALRATGIDDARWYVKRSEHASNPLGYFTPYENLRLALLDYAPIGWMSVYKDFLNEFIQSRNKIYA